MQISIGIGLTSPAVLSRRSVAPAFDPVSLFEGGRAGALFVISPSTCFTDTAGTAPAAVGQAVARVNDLSGNGNHATQVSAAARPILRQTSGGLYYLEYDGVDDLLVVPAAASGAAGSDNTLVFAVRANDGGNFPTILRGQSNAAFVLRFNGATEILNAIVTTTSGFIQPVGTTAYTSQDLIASMDWDRAAGAVRGWGNRTLEASATGTPVNKTVPARLELGVGLIGRIYGGFIIDRKLSDAERADGEAHFAALSGVTLA